MPDARPTVFPEIPELDLDSLLGWGRFRGSYLLGNHCGVVLRNVYDPVDTVGAIGPWDVVPDASEQTAGNFEELFGIHEELYPSGPSEDGEHQAQALLGSLLKELRKALEVGPDIVQLLRGALKPLPEECLIDLPKLLRCLAHLRRSQNEYVLAPRAKTLSSKNFTASRIPSKTGRNLSCHQ
jgi:hypothetical protein